MAGRRLWGIQGLSFHMHLWRLLQSGFRRQSLTPGHLKRDRQMQDKDLVIAIGIPCTDFWIPQFGLSIAALCSYFGMKRFEVCRTQRLHILSSQGSMLPQLRENLVLSAMKKGCSHLLMLDSDMKFSRDVMHQFF